MNRWAFEQKLVIKALKDPAFRKALIEQPKETVRAFLKNESGGERALALLDKLDVRVVEEKKDEWVLSIPSLSTQKGMLKDADLEKAVAGECDLGMTACPGSSQTIASW